MSRNRVRSRRVESQHAPQRVEVPNDPELDLFRSSLERSRARRDSSRRPRRLPIAVTAITAVAALVAAAFVVSGAAERDADHVVAKRERERGRAGGPGVVPPNPRESKAVLPEAGALERAWAYTRERGGLVSFAVIDSRGRMHGYDAERSYFSASISKALLLAAELRRLDAAGAAIDATTRGLLTQMITVSDNDAADAIYYRVGDAALDEVARDVGMRSFSVAGYWANAQVTAADMARFMWNLDDAFPASHREFGLGLLGSVVPSQRWGIPAGAGAGWNVRLKGGWRPTDSGELVHQAAELTRGGVRLAVAVLSDGQPSHEYGAETLRGVADRLVGRMSREPWDGRWR
jgi:Beta-lactamase enzyme family